MRRSILDLKVLWLVPLALATVGVPSRAIARDASVGVGVNWGAPTVGSTTTGGLSTSAQGIGGFGTTIPASARTLRITYRSASLQCCVAIDPRDSRLTGRDLVLTNLQPETAEIQMSAFATDFAPAEGLSATCSTNPSAVALPCDSRFATPSFASEARNVTVVSGTRTSAGALRVFALPFLLQNDLSPAPGGFAGSPVTARFTVVDAAIGVDSDSLTARSVNAGGTESGIEIASKTPCSDIDGPFCSPGGSLNVAGVQVVTKPADYPIGAAKLKLHAANLTGGEMNAAYGFTVNTVFTPTRTATTKPTSTRTFTNTPTIAPTRTPTTPAPTATVTATYRPTGTLQPTRTRTVTPTPTKTKTPTITPTSTVTNTPTSTWTPTRTPTVTATYTVTYTMTPANLECKGTPVSHPLSGDAIALVDDGDPSDRVVKVRISNAYGIDVEDGSDPAFCGATLSIIGGKSGDGVAVISLPPGLWETVGDWRGIRAIRGYRYRDHLSRYGIRTIRLIPGKGGRGTLVIKGGGENWPYRVTRPQTEPVHFRLQIGNDIYCTDFGSASINKSGRFISHKGAAPVTCQ